MKDTLSFNDIVEMSVNWVGENDEIDCDLKLKVDGITLKAHTVSIVNRDLCFYCDKGYITYVIDIYGNQPIAVLYDYEID
jgi:hypothetical protein